MKTRSLAMINRILASRQSLIEIKQSSALAFLCCCYFFIRLSLTDVPFPETFLADALGLRSGKKAFLLESWEGKALALTERTKVEGDFSLGMWEAPSMGLAEHMLQLSFPFILEGLFWFDL